MAVKSPIRYPGGKWKVIDELMELIPNDIEDWREPFFGGGSVTLGLLQYKLKRPKRITVGDLAPEVYNFWAMTQKNPKEIERNVIDIYSKYKEAEELWEYVQSVDCSQIDEYKRAARFYISNKISFNGAGDSGSLSKSNYDQFSLSDCKSLYSVSEILHGIDIRNCSYEEIIFDDMPYGKDKTFVFFDPPYETQAKFGLYGRHGDTHKNFDHDKFAEDCKKLDCKFLITYDDRPSIRRRFNWANIKPFHITYTMAAKRSEDSLNGEELLIANYEINDLESDELF